MALKKKNSAVNIAAVEKKKSTKRSEIFLGGGEDDLPQSALEKMEIEALIQGALQ